MNQLLDGWLPILILRKQAAIIPQVDSTQLKELQDLRADIDRLRNAQTAQNSAAIAADAAQAIGKEPIGNERETRRANVIAEIYHQQYRRY